MARIWPAQRTGSKGVKTGGKAAIVRRHRAARAKHRLRKPQPRARTRGLPLHWAAQSSKTGERASNVQVFVRDNNVDQALKALKKKLQREGVFREMKLRSHYEKPSERRVREKAEAVRRVRKLARKRAQREGLIAAPKPRVPR